MISKIFAAAAAVALVSVVSIGDSYAQQRLQVPKGFGAGSSTFGTAKGGAIAKGGGIAGTAKAGAKINPNGIAASQGMRPGRLIGNDGSTFR